MPEAIRVSITLFVWPSKDLFAVLAKHRALAVLCDLLQIDNQNHNREEDRRHIYIYNLLKRDEPHHTRNERERKLFIFGNFFLPYSSSKRRLVKAKKRYDFSQTRTFFSTDVTF